MLVGYRKISNDEKKCFNGKCWTVLDSLYDLGIYEYIDRELSSKFFGYTEETVRGIPSGF